MKTFQLTKNKFGFTGGFVGMKKEFRAIGAVNLLQYKDFVTMTFNLKGTGKEAKRRLFETATGTLNDGKIELARLDAGTFSDSPHPPFAVNGLLQKKNLSLMFESAFPSVADGYNGFGSLVAIKNR